MSPLCSPVHMLPGVGATCTLFGNLMEQSKRNRQYRITSGLETAFADFRICILGWTRRWKRCGQGSGLGDGQGGEQGSGQGGGRGGSWGVGRKKRQDGITSGTSFWLQILHPPVTSGQMAPLYKFALRSICLIWKAYNWKLQIAKLQHLRKQLLLSSQKTDGGTLYVVQVHPSRVSNH